MKPILRSYQKEVVSRLENMSDYVTIQDIGTATYGAHIYHLYLAKAKGKHKRKTQNVLISGGVHGIEPAGIFAVLDFLEEKVHDYLDYFTFYAYPCINPSGFELVTYETKSNIGINRTFADHLGSIEARLVRDSLRKGPDSYLFTMDFHETHAAPNAHIPNEFWMWELCKDKKSRVGPQIIKAVEKDTPVCKWENINGEKSVDGVIYYPEACIEDAQDLASFDTFLYKYHTNHAFTIETPRWMSIEKRSELHIRALTVMLEEYLKKMEFY